MLESENKFSVLKLIDDNFSYFYLSIRDVKHFIFHKNMQED